MPRIINIVTNKTRGAYGTSGTSGTGGTSGTQKTVIAGGSLYSLFIDENGKAWGSGINEAGQLGDNSVTARCAPVSVVSSAPKTFCKISAGENPFSTYRHSMGIDKNGTLWGWGSNNFFGMMGNPSFASARTPVTVAGQTKTFCEVDCGNAFTIAIDKNGKVWGWGSGNSGRLGNNSVSNQSTPVSVYGSNTFCKISAGPANVLAIDNNGKAWGWGDGKDGVGGRGSTASVNTPVAVCGTRTFCHIAIGKEAAANVAHGLALDNNGRAWAWGANSSGQIGDNSTTSRLSPVCVCGTVRTFCKIATGDQHSLAIDKNGKLWAWGRNIAGQLGINSTTSYSTPVAVSTSKTFCEIAAGFGFSLALDKDNNFWSWGLNNQGQLGDNSTTSRLTPVAVCNI